MPRSMPREVYETLSPFGKKLCREIVEQPGEDVPDTMKDDTTFLSVSHDDFDLNCLMWIYDFFSSKLFSF